MAFLTQFPILLTLQKGNFHVYKIRGLDSALFLPVTCGIMVELPLCDHSPADASYKMKGIFEKKCLQLLTKERLRKYVCMNIKVYVSKPANIGGVKIFSYCPQ